MISLAVIQSRTNINEVWSVGTIIIQEMLTLNSTTWMQYVVSYMPKVEVFFLIFI